MSIEAIAIVSFPTPLERVAIRLLNTPEVVARGAGRTYTVVPLVGPALVEMEYRAPDGELLIRTATVGSLREAHRWIAADIARREEARHR